MKRSFWSGSILVIMNVVVTLGIGVLIGAQAHPAMVHATPPAPPLLLRVKNIQAAIIDLGPAGTSLGDLRVGHSQLYNEQGTRQVGRADFFYSVTNTAVKPGTIALKGELTFTFSQGTVEAAGVSYRRSISALPADDLYAIVGGTGSYLGATGQVRLQLLKNGLTYTFSFAS